MLQQIQELISQRAKVAEKVAIVKVEKEEKEVDKQRNVSFGKLYELIPIWKEFSSKSVACPSFKVYFLFLRSYSIANYDQ